MDLLESAKDTNKCAKQILIEMEKQSKETAQLCQTTKRGFKESNKRIEELDRNNKANHAATRVHATANQQQTMEQFEKGKEDHAKTHNDLSDLKELEKASAAELQEMKTMFAEEKRKQEDRHAQLLDIVSSQKAANPNPFDVDGAGMMPTNLFGGDSPFETDGNGKVTSAATEPCATGTKKSGTDEGEDLEAYCARLQLENANLKEKQRALTAPKDHVGLSEVLPSALNQSGRAKIAEAKHVEEKTKRRQQDEQGKAMMKQRYVPKPTPSKTRAAATTERRVTRSRAAAKK